MDGGGVQGGWIPSLVDRTWQLHSAALATRRVGHLILTRDASHMRVYVQHTFMNSLRAITAVVAPGWAARGSWAEQEEGGAPCTAMDDNKHVWGGARYRAGGGGGRCTLQSQERRQT